MDNRHDCRRGQKDEKRYELLSEIEAGTGGVALAGALDLGHYCAHTAYTRDLIGPAGSDDGGARSSRGRNGDRNGDMD